MIDRQFYRYFYKTIGSAMKPPTRSRSKPTRFYAGGGGTDLTPPTPERRHRRVLRWTPAQRQRLLNALKALGRTYDAGSAPLDYTALQTRMPKTPVDEIQCMVEALQNKVLSHVSHGLRKENQEERRLDTPIELWVEQACRVTGALEEPILTAFSQMFTISSMEPGSQRSTHPTHVPLTSTVPPPRIPAPHPLTSTVPPPRIPAPHPLTSTVPPPRSPAPHPLTSTVPPPRSPAPHTLTSTSSPSRSLAGGRTVNLTPTPRGSDSPGQQSSCSASPALVPTQRTPGPSQTTGTPDPPHNTTLRTLGPPQTTGTPDPPHSPALRSPGPPQTTALRTPGPPQTTAQRTPGPPQTLQSQTPMGGPLNQTTGSPRLRSHQARQCHNVDFSKIYSYLGEVDSEKQDRCVLTAMESAVVLELLMCLPEELHLLDGSELHRHFMEVYEVLSSPVISSVKAERSRRPAAPSGGQTTHSSPACHPDSQSDSTARHPDGQSASTAHLEKNADTATPVESSSNQVGRGGATNSKGRDQDMMSSTNTTPTCQSSSTQTESTNHRLSDWERAGLCPLNPFRVPLKLLERHT